MTRTVVFAYHNIGVRCLAVLLAQKVEVLLVITHRDNPNENIWFESVAELAARHGIPVITPDDPNTPAVMAQMAALRPDFIFSFYYRHMLKPALLRLAGRGAYNMHGSLLPKYRGRVPVNWAVINGEEETGATLHRMVEKPDAGEIVDQQAVPILMHETAGDVFAKVADAAAIVLERSLPALIAGTAPHTPQKPDQSSYYGGRKPEDGLIDWRESGWKIHNLVRGVAPPFPGAFTHLQGKILRVLLTLPAPQRRAHSPEHGLYCAHGRCYADCSNGHVLRLLQLEYDGQPLDAKGFLARFGERKIPFDAPPSTPLPDPENS